MQIRKILLHNPSEPLFAAHLPLHKGGFGAVRLMKKYIFSQAAQLSELSHYRFY